VPIWKRAPRSRDEVIGAGDRARARGRLEAAAAAYRSVLAEHGPDPRVHGKLAPVLVLLKDRAGAAASFRSAAEGHLAAGFLDRALAVYCQARQALPLEPEFHSSAAHMHLLRGRRIDAAAVLAQGGRVVGRRDPAAAMDLLRSALSIQPANLEAVVALAPLLRRERRSAEALELLAQVEPGARGRALRRVRWAIFRAAPGFRTGWRWLAACAARGGVERARRRRPKA
jgi:tetratricopeptide (TPR) repeat protein